MSYFFMLFVFQKEVFLNRDLHPVFETDALTTSHPIYVPVTSNSQIIEIFDQISYSKVRCSSRVQSAHVLHVLYMGCTCVVHVLYMCCTCVVVLYICCACAIHGLYMCCTCVVHVLYMCCCVVHLLCMCYTCVVHVLCMCCTCGVHVLHIYACTFVICLLTSRCQKLHE